MFYPHLPLKHAPMKRIFSLAAIVAVLSMPAQAVVILSEDFETDGNGTRYTTSTLEFSDGGGDFFTRTDGTNIGGFINLQNVTGSWFAASDIDGEGADRRQTLTFSGIPIAGFDSFRLSMDVAEDDDGTNQDWDADDLVHASFSIDGVPPSDFASGYAIWFDNDGATNTAPLLNPDFDADGDGPEVTDTFTTFSRDLGFSTGSTADLVITFDLNSGDEDFHVDNIVFEGFVTAVPEPGSMVVLGSLAIGGIITRRRRSKKI